MPKALVSCFCCITSLLASAALAEPAAPTTPSTTVAPVTVQGATPKTIQAQSRAFVLSLAAAPNPELGQISRWHEAVCVSVVGLAQASQAKEIKERIESVAQAVGLRAARPNCEANVEIVFADDPQGAMDIVAKRREDLLGYYHRTERNKLKTVTHPIQAWYKTATRGEGGNAALVFADIGAAKHDQSYAGQGFPGRTSGNLRTDDPDLGTPTGCGDSPHFTSCLTSEFENVFIVADGKALQGQNLGPTAEYLVMLALSQPKSLDACSALPSILDRTAKPACAGRDPPVELTSADAAWLTALYASDGANKGDGERSDIANRMADILIKASMPAGGR